MGLLERAGAGEEDTAKARALFVRLDAKKPSAADLKELQALWAKWPEAINDLLGLAHAARQKVIQEATDPGLSRESSVMYADQLIVDLGRDKVADPLEKLLIEQIATVHVFHSILEYKYAQIVNSNDASLEQSAFWESRINSSQKRLIRAVDALARYRKLQRYEPDLHLHPAPELHLHQSPPHVQSRSED